MTLEADQAQTEHQGAPEIKLERDICIHIFTASAAMIGVCLTMIGLVRVVITLRKSDTLADDLLAGDAALFLFSCLSSYWALRTRSVRRMHRVEQFADIMFLAALVGMVFICGFVVWAISARYMVCKPNPLAFRDHPDGPYR